MDKKISFTFVCDQSFADRFIIEAWQGEIFSGQSVTVDGDGESDGKEGFTIRKHLDMVIQSTHNFYIKMNMQAQ